MKGGHALKNTFTGRKTTAEFLDISNRLMPILRELFDTELYVLKFYHTKPDHGDMDILLKVDNTFYNKGINIRNAIKERLNPNEIVVNDGTVTFDFEEFQIDLSPVAESVWETTKFWMDYDPSSNLLGKQFHKFGLKYGPDSLRYPYRGGSGRVLKDIIITKDIDEIYNFLGLSSERKYKGFDTLEEIYDWVISNKYFNPELFLLNNLIHSDRVRNRKRSTFNKFLEYIKDLPYKSEDYHFERNKTKYLDLIDSSFPKANFLKQIKELELKDKSNQIISAKFNGNLVMNWTGKKNKELGDILLEYKKIKAVSYFKETEKEIIEKDFLEWYKNK
jgi:hypothetical protein